MKSSSNYYAATKQTQIESNSLVQYHSEVFMPKVYLHIKNPPLVTVIW